MVQFIDSHAHLTCDPLFEDIDGILERAFDAGVHAIINICTDQLTTERSLKWDGRHASRLYTVGGTLPNDVEELGAQDFPFFENLARNGKIIALGETGLDYYYERSPRSLQKEFLIRYFGLAKDLNLPLVIHCRDAFADFFSLADRYFGREEILIHCFTGTLDEMHEIIARGWKLSLSGIVTFKGSKHNPESLREVAKAVPLSNLLIETDSPYLAPLSKRGKNNEPSFIVETAAEIARIRGISLEEVGQTTADNACKFFKI